MIFNFTVRSCVSALDKQQLFGIKKEELQEVLHEEHCLNDKVKFLGLWGM